MDNIAILINRFTNTEIVDLVKAYYNKDNVFFVYDDISPGIKVDINGYGMIDVFHVRFTNTKILVTRKEDMQIVNEYHNTKILTVRKEDLLKTIDDPIIDLKKTEILILESKRIRKAKNAELQPSFR